MNVRSEWERFSFRLPHWLRMKLEQAATENGRSLNAEIVYRLRASLDGYSKDLLR